MTSSPLRRGPQRGVANARTGCESLASSRVLLDLCSRVNDWWACKVLPARMRLGVGSTRSSTLLTFASPSKTQSGSRGPWSLSTLAQAARELPLRVSVRVRTPLMGLSEIAPPSAWASSVHSQPRLAPESGCLAMSRRTGPGSAAWPLARSCHTPDSFRPCRSSRLRRFAPLDASQVCCTLKPIVGFARLQVAVRQGHVDGDLRGDLRPTVAAVTSEEVPVGTGALPAQAGPEGPARRRLGSALPRARRAVPKDRSPHPK